MMSGKKANFSFQFIFENRNKRNKMLINLYNKEAVLLCVLLSISTITALARVDNNWSHRRPNITVAQNQGSQFGYRPAGVGYQQPLVHNQAQFQRHNQTHQWQQHNNRTPVNAYQPSYAQVVSNQTRPIWPQPSATKRPQYPSHGQGPLNQTRTGWQQGSLNQTRPSWLQPNAPQPPNYPVYPSYGQQGSLNQTRPSWAQPSAPRPSWLPNNSPQAPKYPQYPPYNQQGILNQTRPSWSQAPAPQAPAYSTLSNNSNNIPSAPLWTPSANQTNLYPQLPNKNFPQPAPSVGNSGIPLAPLQPGPQSPQGRLGPQNWQSGGQGVFSYGPGYYPAPAANSNNNPSTHQGSSNPYANMFN